jgi:hypothetical protein
MFKAKLKIKSTQPLKIKLFEGEEGGGNEE